MLTPLRLPDFVVIGAMKSGTTTLFHWLTTHPDVRMPAAKEPNFFSDDRRWRQGLGWYGEQFEAVPEDKLTGEASVSYTDPRLASAAAQRLQAIVPHARLVCVLRDPLERMRSHYAHEVQRGRERRPFGDAVAAPGNPYLLRSSYAAALAPWVELFPPEQLAVVRFEELFDGPAQWESLLRFLGLAPIERPSGTYNATASKRNFSPVMRMLWDRKLVVQRAHHAPPRVRRIGGRLLLRSSEKTRGLSASSAGPVPAGVVAEVSSQMDQLANLLPHLRLAWELDG